MKAEIKEGVLILTPKDITEDQILITWYRDNRQAKECQIQVNRN